LYLTEVRDAARSQPAVSASARVVIVGSGAGGYVCAELLARGGFSGSVTVISDDPDPPYDRNFCSKRYLIGMKSRQATLIDGPTHRPEVRSGCSVKSLDAERKMDTAGQR
jgi:NADPH-dependent 2,4-dienoyl-CoA reductase/sulfur reductase-like enzyme